MAEALEKIDAYLSDGRQHYIVTPNPEFIVLAQKDKEFMEILNKADLNIPDGIGIVWASRFFGEPLKERVAGADLIEKIKIQISKIKMTDQNLKIFLLGGKNRVAEKIAEEWPDIVGFSEDTDTAVELINNHNPDILVVALGAPKQEKWISQNLSKFPSAKLAIGVGGAFDFLSGRIKRAPKFMQRFGLEWLWRLICEPRRFSRIADAVIKFPWLVFKDRIKASFNRG